MLGELVLIKVTKISKGLSSKLFDKSDGPYRIVELGPNFTYKVRRFRDHKLHASLVNASNLKGYNDPEIHREHLEPNAREPEQLNDFDEQKDVNDKVDQNAALDQIENRIDIPIQFDQGELSQETLTGPNQDVPHPDGQGHVNNQGQHENEQGQKIDKQIADPNKT